VASLVDTNVLVYCFDPRSPAKQVVARDVLYRGLEDQNLVLPHQAILEFVSATTRPRSDLSGASLLAPEVAYREAEGLMRDFPVIYPDQDILNIALRGVSIYGLSWFDAHLWAYAEVNGLPEILSEDFEHGRHYGHVRVVDPFLVAANEIHELPPMYDTPGPQ
jgi:predicted nucleic acid-binding protein